MLILRKRTKSINVLYHLFILLGLFSICSGLAAKIYLTDQESAFLNSKKNFTMCVGPDFMPFEDIKEGKHIGLAAELIQIISQNIGIPFQLQPTHNWLETMEKARLRECDIVSFLLKTPARTEFLDFTRPYFSEPFAIATTKDKPYVRDVKELLDKKVALVKGYAYVEILQNKYPNLQIIQVDSIDQGLLMLSNREIYAYLDGLNVIAYKIQKYGYQHLKVNGEFSGVWNMRIGSRNDMPIIQSILNKGIQSIRSEDRARVSDKWLKVTYEYHFDYKVIFVILLMTSSLILAMLIRQKSLKEKNRELERLSETDKLTKLSNRRKLDQYLQHYIDRFERYDESFSVAMIDIDRFKMFNDQFGHLVGDKVLIAVANLLEQNSRKIDIIGRWGGEEFLIICPNTDIQAVEILAHSLCKTIAEDPFKGILSSQSEQSKRPTNNSSLLTISVGIAQIMVKESLDDVVDRADKALLRAKKAGRNQIKKAQ